MNACLIAVLFIASGIVPTTPSPGLKHYYPVPAQAPKIVEADVVVYGGTPGGVAAAVQASRMGKSAVLVVFRRHVGGMTSGGLTATDVGNEKAIGGIAKEFYQKVGKLRNYRPSEAETAFRGLLADAKVPVYFEHRIAGVKKDGNRITALECENGVTFHGKVFIDTTYEGDLLANAGVRFHVGREANASYGETINGIQYRSAHNFIYPVDPYVDEGKPASGLLWGVSSATPGKQGDPDSKIQAYNFRMRLTNGEDRLPFPKPAGYDPVKYKLLTRYLTKFPTPAQIDFGQAAGPFELKNGDCNNSGGFSTDYIGANYGWPEGNHATREKIFQDHVNYQQGLLYFCTNDPSVPELVRNRIRKFGLDAKEFPETGGWPHELYVREARRMVSAYVMSQKNCQSAVTIDDSVGLAAYNMDSHNCQRLVIDGKVRNEGDVQVRCSMPYSVSYRSIVPKEAECANLFVPVCLSASHIAYGSIRMEPVFMVLGHSAGTAAAMAVNGRISVQQVEYTRLKERLTADGQVLTWIGPKK